MSESKIATCLYNSLGGSHTHLFFFKKTKGFFGFFVQWHINFCRLFNAKAILQEEQ